MTGEALATTQSPWLTVPEAAGRARVGTRTIYNACKSNQLRHSKIGSRAQIRIHESWVGEWLERLATPVIGGAARRVG